jgi:hypothetical protein
MSELSDYKRIVSGPQIAKLEDANRRQAARIAELERVAEAARGLFVGGFIEAGAKQESEWSAELARRLKPLRAALSALPAVKQEVGELGQLARVICDELYHLPTTTDAQAGTCMDAADLLLYLTGTRPVEPSDRISAALMPAGAGRE